MSVSHSEQLRYMETDDCWVVCSICPVKVSGHFFPALWRGGFEFSILSPLCNRASPCLENCWGIKEWSITPRWTVRLFYMWLSPRCTPVGATEGVKSFQNIYGMLACKASWWISDGTNAAWLSCGEIFILAHVYLKKYIYLFHKLFIFDSYQQFLYSVGK